MRFAVALAARHPRFHVVFAHLSQPQFARANGDDAVRQVESLQDIFGILQQL